MGKILVKNETLKNTIVTILENSIRKKERVQNPELTLSNELDMNIEVTGKILRSILTGIEDVQ